MWKLVSAYDETAANGKGRPSINWRGRWCGVTGRGARGPRGERGEQADKIIAAARRSFATRGYAATSLRSVAQDADVDPGLVHYYFRTKTGLLEAVMQPPEAFGAT